MKKTILFCFVMMTCLLIAQEAKPLQPVLKAQVLEDVIKPDTAVTVKLTVELQNTYNFCQRSFYAYFPNLPEGFPDLAEQLKYEKNLKPKSFKWNSVKFDNKWIPDADRKKTEHIVTIPVKGWPAGDYCLHVNGYFKPIGKDSGLQAVYRVTSFLFTIEE